MEEIDPDAGLLAGLSDDKVRRAQFTLLVRKYQQRLYYYVRRIVVSHEDADDVVQNSFIKIWNGLPGFRGESKLSSWLYRIATNEALTHIQRRNRIAGIPLDELEERLPGHLSQDALFDGNELARRLQAAIATLPEKQKLVFILKYFEERKYHEIAEITGTSVGALKASYHHAIDKIKKNLGVD